MALNYLWIAFFLVAFVVALIRLIFFGDTEIFKLIVDGTFESAKTGVMDIALPLVGIMTLWLGIMNKKPGQSALFPALSDHFLVASFPKYQKTIRLQGTW
jgi:spore maturation protein SpmA